MLVAGTYEFASDDDGGDGDDDDDDDDDDNEGCPAVLYIDRSVTIEAEVTGSVVLDGKGVRRVIFVSSGGSAELIGLNITGGYACDVRARLSILS